MRIIIYLIFVATIGSYASMAQKPINKSGELWAVWEEAEKKLEAGQFDKAIILYRAYEPNFSFRLKQTLELRRIYNEGLRLQKARRYTEAINTYKKQRDLEGVGSLIAFDRQIDVCIKQMASPAGPGIKETERRIIATELAYNGQKKLRDLDTLGALRDYSQAKKYAGNFSGSFREQYEEGLKITEELREWGRKYKKLQLKGSSPEQERNALESYRRIKGVPVLNSVEIKIREVVAIIEGKNSLLSFAQNCETDLLLSYVNQNKARLAFSESLVSTLNQYKSIQNKIVILKSGMENAKTVKSAYFSMDSMAKSVKELPDDVKKSLEECIKNDKTKTFEAYTQQARRAGDLIAAKEFDAIAHGTENIEINLAACTVSEDFSNSVVAIQEKLRTCNPGEARRIWSRISLQLANCPYKEEILRPYQSMVNSIGKIESEERVFNTYNKDVQNLMLSENFEEAKVKYLEMSQLGVCITPERDEEIRRGLKIIKIQQRKWIYRFGLTGAVGVNKPMYRIDNQSIKMGYGLVTSGGIDFSFIDHNNPIDLVAGVEYLSTSYHGLNYSGMAVEGYKLNGVNVSLNIKIHGSNTNPNKLRPYFKIGRDGIIPVSYEYENYSTHLKTTDKKQLKSVISSIQGGLGLEMQKRHVGFFVEADFNYGINGTYDKSAPDIAVAGNKQVEANFRRLGVKLGFRFY